MRRACATVPPLLASLILAAAAGPSASSTSGPATSMSAPTRAFALQAQQAVGVPLLDHVILVVMENHSYDQVRTLPYISTLIQSSTSFSQAYAVAHPSHPNYLALRAASTLGISNDNCPPAGSPYTAANLGQACQGAGRTWKSYCENLPAAGSTVCSSTDGLYYRKPPPCPDFSNLDHAHE